MIQSTKPSLIDAVELGEVSVSFIHGTTPSMSLVGRYALTVATTRQRLGMGTRTFWSEETHNKLRELVSSMEADIFQDVFGESPTVSPVSDAVDDVPGL